MLEARHRHRQSRARQRGAVTPWRNLERRARAAARVARRSASVTERASQVVVNAVHLLVCAAFGHAYRLASWVALPVPGSVVAVGILLSLLSGRVVSPHWAEKVVATLLKLLSVGGAGVAVVVLASGDLTSVRGITLALTLLGGAVVCVAVSRAQRWLAGARMRVLASLASNTRIYRAVARFPVPIPRPSPVAPGLSEASAASR